MFCDVVPEQLDLTSVLFSNHYMTESYIEDQSFLVMGRNIEK